MDAPSEQNCISVLTRWASEKSFICVQCMYVNQELLFSRGIYEQAALHINMNICCCCWFSLSNFHIDDQWGSIFTIFSLSLSHRMTTIESKYVPIFLFNKKWCDRRINSIKPLCGLMHFHWDAVRNKNQF